METSSIIILSAILGFLVILFIVAIVVTKVLISRRQKVDKTSLTNAGNDTSDFSQQLMEKYRNES